MIKLYSTHCPQCKVLETKLDRAQIKYEVIDDQDEMIRLGFKSAPVLEVDGKAMPFAEAVKWVNNR